MDFEELKWNVAHDPCRTGDRMPLGAVEAGADVEVVLRVGWPARGALDEVILVVNDEDAADGGPARREVRMEAHPEGFSARLPLHGRPRVVFYLFELHLAGGGLCCYVPASDGRSTAGELVRCGIDGDVVEGRWRPDARLAGARPSGEFGLAGVPAGFQVTVYEPSFATPAWLSGAVMYQIFPDRFARGSKGVRASGLAYHEKMGRPVRLHRDWGEPVEWTGAPKPVFPPKPDGATRVAGESAAPDVRGARRRRDSFAGQAEDAACAEALARAMRAYDPIDFFGGTLEGICERLDYLAGLGVEVLYLNPVFEARSNHRYDTADYERIDALLGDGESFERLAREAGLRGIRLVLDAVLSHTGDDSRYFNARGSYDAPGAMQGHDSPYRSWYDFTPHASGTPYRSWWGDPTLPEVDERDPSWQRYVLGGRPAACQDEHPDRDAPADAGSFESGILPGWLARGAAGYRLDVADEIPDDVLELVRASVKGADPDAAIIGEVWEDPTTKSSYGARRRYALGGSLDSVMNYPLRGALIGFGLGSLDAFQLATFLKSQQANYPAPLYRCCMNLLSTHDVERLRSLLALGGPVKHLARNEQLERVGAITPDQDLRAARLQQLLVGLLFALPGAPCIYYGDERGLHGGGDPFCRATFPWDDEPSSARRGDRGADLTAFYRRLATLRKESRVLRDGELACAACGPDAVFIARVASGEGAPVVAAVNRGTGPVRASVDFQALELGISEQARDLLSQLRGGWRLAFHVGAPEAASSSACSEFGILSLDIPASSLAYFTPIC